MGNKLRVMGFVAGAGLIAVTAGIHVCQLAYEAGADAGYKAGLEQGIKIMLGGGCVVSFLMICVGVQGRGHPFYLAGGWIIGVAAGNALVWW